LNEHKQQDMTSKSTAAIIIIGIAGLLYGCSTRTDEQSKNTKTERTLDIEKIESVLQMKGTIKDGEYKVTVPQNDLNVTVDGFKIIPPMGLGSWVAFTPSSEGAMIMGDIVVTETDLSPVQQEVVRQGLTVTAIHNHFVRDKPHVMYMHIGGMGSDEQLARAVKAVLDKVTEVRGMNPAEGSKSEVANTLNAQALDNLLGSKSEMTRGVLKHTIGRPDVDLKDHGASVTSFAGFNTWAAWQGTAEHAAVAGDFAMLEDEVAAVIKALVENGIEVVAVHNHMVHEEPRIFFLHYWGVGPAEQLARALRAALDQTGKGNQGATASTAFPAVAEVICKSN
jgi:hypothetical protein